MDENSTGKPAETPQVDEETGQPVVLEPQASSHTDAPECRLTDLMIAELSAHDGLEDIAATVAAARKGDKRALSTLTEWSISISRRDFATSWDGANSISDVIGALNSELNHLKPHNTSRRSLSTQPSVPRTGFAPIADVVNSVMVEIGSPEQHLLIPQSAPIPEVPKKRDFSRRCRPTKSFEHREPMPRWPSLAREAGYPIKTLPKSHREVLNVVDNVTAQGKGWGPKDPERGRRNAVNLVPSKLRAHGLKLSERTYQRAIRNLVDRGLIIHVTTEIDRTGVYAPAWSPVDSPEAAVDVWRKLANGADPQPKMSDQCRANVAPVSHQCRTNVAPPVPTRTAATHFVCKRVGPVGVRHITGRFTSYCNYKHLNECGTAFHGLDTRDAPCLPKGQARRAVLFSGDAADDSE